jgi:hypothetical protein
MIATHRRTRPTARTALVAPRGQRGLRAGDVAAHVLGALRRDAEHQRIADSIEGSVLAAKR